MKENNSYNIKKIRLVSYNSKIPTRINFTSYEIKIRRKRTNYKNKKKRKI